MSPPGLWFIIAVCPIAASAQAEDEVFHYLIPLAEAVNLSESGQHKQVITKTKQLLFDLDKNKKPTAKVIRPLPVLRSDTSCGDTYRQVRAETYALQGLSGFALKQTAQAIADLKQAAKLCPENAYVLCDLGTAYVKLKKPKDAIPVLNQAIKLNSNLREAYFMRADAYQQIGKRKEAQSDVRRSQQLMTAQQNNIDSLTERIDKLVQENKIVDAIKLDKELLLVAPRDGLAVSGYADHLASSGKYKDALNLVSTAIALDPSNAYPFRIRSVINSHLQKQDQELRDANKAFNLEPRSAEALNARAIANLDSDRPVQAIRDFDLLLKRKPEYTDAYINRSAAYLRTGDFENATKDAKQAVSLAPASPYGYQCLGAALRRAGKLSEARDALVTSLRYSKSATKDSLAMAEFNLGAVLLALNDSKASEHFNNAIGAAPNLAEVLFQRGAYNSSLGKIDDAIKILTRKPTRATNTSKITKLVKITAPTPRAKHLKGWTEPTPPSPQIITRSIRVSSFDLKDCELIASFMIDSKPSKPDIYYTRGLARFCLKQYVPAADDLKKFASLTKSDIPYQRGLVLAFLSLERAGKLADAKNCLLAAAKVSTTTSGSIELKSARSNRGANSSTSSASILELKYFLNELAEPALFAKDRAIPDQTRSHAYLGIHFNTTGDKVKAKTHEDWVTSKGPLTSPELILSAADKNNQAKISTTTR